MNGTLKAIGADDGRAGRARRQAPVLGARAPTASAVTGSDQHVSSDEP